MPEEPVSRGDLGPIDAYLVEARSIGGLSGTPVFVHMGGVRTLAGKARFRGGSFYWLGLMHGHWDLPVSYTDSLAENISTGERVNMGIAIVVPAMKILEVLTQPQLVEMRRREEVTPSSPEA